PIRSNGAEIRPELRGKPASCPTFCDGRGSWVRWVPLPPLREPRTRYARSSGSIMGGVIREPGSEPLPGYVLIEPRGRGGFGEVWKCEAPGGLTKAIKFVYGNLNSLDADAKRAEQEQHALQRIREVRHPFVLSTERIEIISGELVIVMELADSSLHDLYV